MDLPAKYSAQNEAHIARLDPRMQPLARKHLELCHAEGLPVVITDGVRDEERQQLEKWAKGRKQLPDGTWVVVDASQVITNAQTLNKTPHGKATCAAYDIAFLINNRLVSVRPGPNNDSWDDELPWTNAGELGERAGLKWGGRWRTERFPRGDRPHFEHPDWRSFATQRSA